ncbi:unnamed protein product [Arabis nemorensis]|uniref:DUF4005 domain-containing protein n=1 Tax=Arabis nemorensis TaxID=586526 RepID=A0A565AQH6_9BRAS|nr:unnamed protein product [Arabis nemorensis]
MFFGYVNLESGNDSEEVELEHAVVKVQAAFRAHQARRAFRTLKGIIRLQAVIRGHLVRRQAVATYSCIWGIVKFQALVRGQKARSSDNGIQCHKTHKEIAGDDSEALQLSTYSWMNNPTKFFFVEKLLASSPTALPLKIQYGPEEPNSAKVWLERWTQLQVWSPGSRAAKILVPKPKTKKRNYQEVVETEKARPKPGVKKQSGRNIGNGSNRSATESEKPKRNVRKASTLSKDPMRNESDKEKHNSRKSRSASKEGSPFEIKDVKPRPNVKRSSLSNGLEKATRKSAEKKKDTADSVQIKPEVKVADVLEGEDTVESAEKKKDTIDSMQIEPEVKVADVLDGEFNVESAEKKKDTADSVEIEPEVKVATDVLEGGFTAEFAEKKKDTADSVQIEPEVKVADVVEGGDTTVESAEKEKDATDVVPKVFDVEKEEIAPEEDEPRAAETSDKGEVLKCSDVKVSSENGNIGSDNTKPTERRVSLSANIDNQDDGLKHSGRKIPSYMAPTASAKARVKGEGSPRFSQEKTEKNETLRRHSLASPANGKMTTTTMSPRAQKLLLVSAKGSMNGVKSFTSSKDISGKQHSN